MSDFEFKLKDGNTGWVSNLISPLLDEYPVGFSKDVKEGVLFFLNDGTSRTVLYNQENACCVIKNEMTGENVKLGFGDFLSEEGLESKVFDSLEDVKKPNLDALKRQKLQLEKELREVNEEIERAENKLERLEKKQTKSRKL